MKPVRLPVSARRAALLALCLEAACAPRGRYVWVDAYQPPTPSADTYLLQPGDVLSIRVLNQENMSTRVRVRTDGRVSLPFFDDVQAAGRTPTQLAESLRQGLLEYLRHPVVTVILEETLPLSISVTGEVMRPGVYTLEPRASVLQALASAGGLSQFADPRHIYVLRPTATSGPPVRIRFDYEVLSRAEGRGASFSLQRNDVIVVE